MRRVVTIEVCFAHPSNWDGKVDQAIKSFVNDVVYEAHTSAVTHGVTVARVGVVPNRKHEKASS